MSEECANDQITGGCLCGGVRYTAIGPAMKISNCHCSQCRKWTGHIFASTTVPMEGFVLAGEASLSWYESSDFARRGFCNRCGSSLFWQRKDADHLDLLAGTLDQPSGLTTMDNIFVADKGDYYEIRDGLPEHPGVRQELTGKPKN